MKKKRYRLKRTVIAKFIIFLSLIGIVFSSITIIKWTLNIMESARIKDQLDSNIKKIINEKTSEEEYIVDFAKLKKENSDTVAYLKVNGTKIDYVVVKALDNDYYLDRNFYKKKSVTGWIFADYHNKFDGTDRNIVIYGHNTKDGSMFGSLKNILNKNWYQNKDNYDVLLITESNTYHYKVFSTYSIEPEDYYIDTLFNDNEKFAMFIKILKERSFYNYQVDVNENDKIITLSSCIDSGKKRVVLHAKLIDEGE